MQIVIDIPDEMFDWYDNGFPEEDDAEKLWQIVKNGTPLPKEHGKIGDLDALREEVSSWGMNDYEPSDFIDVIDQAETIIPEDKEEEE